MSVKHWGIFSNLPFLCGKPFIREDFATSVKSVTCPECLQFAWSQFDNIRKSFPEIPEKIKKLKDNK